MLHEQHKESGVDVPQGSSQQASVIRPSGLHRFPAEVDDVDIVAVDGPVGMRVLSGFARGGPAFAPPVSFDGDYPPGREDLLTAQAGAGAFRAAHPAGRRRHDEALEGMMTSTSPS